MTRKRDFLPGVAAAIAATLLAFAAFGPGARGGDDGARRAGAEFTACCVALF